MSSPEPGVLDPYKAAAMLVVAFAGVGQTLMGASPEGDFGFFINTDDPFYLTAVAANGAADLAAAILVCNDLRNLYYGNPRTYTLCYSFKGYLAIESLELMLGFGPPYQGDNLRSSAEQFNKLSEQLEVARPNSSWRGVAAQAYGSSVTRLSRAISDLAKADSDLAFQAKMHGGNVSQIRAMMGLLKDLCIIACVVEARMAITDTTSAKALGVICGGFGVGFSAIGAGLLAMSSANSITNFVDAVTTAYGEVDPGVGSTELSAPTLASASASRGLRAGTSPADPVVHHIADSSDAAVAPADGRLPVRAEGGVAPASLSVPGPLQWPALAQPVAKFSGYTMQVLNLLGSPGTSARPRVETAAAAGDAESATPGLPAAIAEPVAAKNLLAERASVLRPEATSPVGTAAS